MSAPTDDPGGVAPGPAPSGPRQPPTRERDRNRELEWDRDIPSIRLPHAEDTGDNPAIMRMLLPVGRSGWAIAAGYLALFSVLCIPAPFALVAGILAIVQMRRDPTKHGMVRAVFGIFMGSIGTALLLLMLASMLSRGL